MSRSRRVFATRRWLSCMDQVAKYRVTGDFWLAREFLNDARAWRNVIEGARS